MQACFKSYRNQTRDIPLVSVWRENETFIAFFEECGAEKNTDHVFFLIYPNWTQMDYIGFLIENQIIAVKKQSHRGAL